MSLTLFSIINIHSEQFNIDFKTYICLYAHGNRCDTSAVHCQVTSSMYRWSMNTRTFCICSIAYRWACYVNIRKHLSPTPWCEKEGVLLNTLSSIN